MVEGAVRDGKKRFRGVFEESGLTGLCYALQVLEPWKGEIGKGRTVVADSCFASARAASVLY